MRNTELGSNTSDTTLSSSLALARSWPNGFSMITRRHARDDRPLIDLTSRAEANQRESTAEDLVWAQKRLATIKEYLVPGFQLPGWDDDGDRLELLRSNKALAPLLRLPDPDDVHVALAAADWAQATGRDVVLATDNLKDLPAKVLAPFGVVPLHPGDVLQLVYQMDPEGTASSLQKTAADFKNPAFSLLDMLASIKSPQQFDNQELAAELAVRWELAVPGASQGTTKARTK